MAPLLDGGMGQEWSQVDVQLWSSSVWLLTIAVSLSASVVLLLVILISCACCSNGHEKSRRNMQLQYGRQSESGVSDSPHRDQRWRSPQDKQRHGSPGQNPMEQRRDDLRIGQFKYGNYPDRGQHDIRPQDYRPQDYRDRGHYDIKPQASPRGRFDRGHRDREKDNRGNKGEMEKVGKVDTKNGQKKAKSRKVIKWSQSNLMVLKKIEQERMETVYAKAEAAPAASSPGGLVPTASGSNATTASNALPNAPEFSKASPFAKTALGPSVAMQPSVESPTNLPHGHGPVPPMKSMADAPTAVAAPTASTATPATNAGQAGNETKVVTSQFVG